MGDRERRRSLVVNKEAQRRIVLAVALFPAVALAMATMMIAVFSRKLLGEANEVEAALPSLVPLFVATLGFAVVSIAIILNQALRFSNKVSGPAYRFCKTFQEIQDGEPIRKIKLRDGDHLTEVADAFNEFTEWLQANLPERSSNAANESQPAEAPAAERVPVDSAT